MKLSKLAKRTSAERAGGGRGGKRARVRQSAWEADTLPAELLPLGRGAILAQAQGSLNRTPGRRSVGGFSRSAFGGDSSSSDTAQTTAIQMSPTQSRVVRRPAAEAGFRDTRRIASVPSRFLGSIYSAVSVA